MNLRTVRWRLAIVYGIVTTLAVGGIAIYAVTLGEDRIYESAEREAENMVATYVIDDRTPAENLFWVDLDNESGTALDAASVEPPLLTIVNDIGGTEGFEHFEQDGTWIAYARSRDSNQFLVSAVSLEDYESDVDALRLRIAVAAVASIAAASLAGWFVAGRSMEPARRAARQQRDFIADAAHELRTPLAVIQASSSQALRRDRSPDEYRESLHEVHSAAERASAGVAELLELARLESGQANPRMAPLRLDLLIEEVASGVRLDGVEILAQPMAAVVVDADYALLRQVLDTLTRNAAARASTVMLSVVELDGRAVLDVVDDGAGFEPDVLPYVFDRFRRGDTLGGSGLGMAIAKSVVEAHRGGIEASNLPDGGARVRVTLRTSSPGS